jgi:replication factor A1
MFNLTLVCHVIEKQPPRRVTIRSTGRGALVCDAKVADETASISLTLWNEDIDLVDREETYRIENARVGVFDECMFITPGRNGRITMTQHLESPSVGLNMSLPFAWKPKRKPPKTKRGRSLTESTGRGVRRYVGRKSF